MESLKDTIETQVKIFNLKNVNTKNHKCKKPYLHRI